MSDVVRCQKCGNTGWAGPKYVRFSEMPRGTSSADLGWPLPFGNHPDALAVQCITCGFQRFFPTVENGGQPIDPVALQGPTRGKKAQAAPEQAVIDATLQGAGAALPLPAPAGS